MEVDADFVVDSEELVGEEEVEEENNPDKPMYPPLNLAGEGVCYSSCIYFIC